MTYFGPSLSNPHVQKDAPSRFRQPCLIFIVLKISIRWSYGHHKPNPRPHPHPHPVFPHPGFWRLIFGTGAFYALLLVAMSVLAHKDARWIFESIFGDFGTWKQFLKDSESSKGETMSSCDISPLAIFKQIFFAPWFLSHALGWMGKMMIFRDWGVCLLAALMFEVSGRSKRAKLRPSNRAAESQAHSSPPTEP